MKNIIICDIDGTLCTDEHRNHLLQQPCELPHRADRKCPDCQGSGFKRTSTEWDKYFDLCHLDPPVEAVIKVLQMFAGMSAVSNELKPGHLEDEYYRIHLMTARVDTVAEKTLSWLRQHNVPFDSITFRPADCRLQDNVLKTKWADELGGPERVLFVLEDRQRVVDAWRIAGYTCFQVAPGNF